VTTCAIGTVDISKHHDGERWRITIDHAHPRILISHELLETIDRSECEPYARITKTCACSPGIGCPHYQGARLEVEDSDGRRFVYVIGEPDFSSWAWSAEWPD
jgi:hypothetical protein